jgi:hypothetical protein
MLDHSAEQLVYYDQGVGTERFEKIRGGAFATGLSAKVMAGYLWLMENYRGEADSPTRIADDVYIFGFSRGAFTARSLVGVLSLCGLVRRDAPTSVANAFRISRTEGFARRSSVLQRFRAEFSDEIRVKFLGVWDTVAALGVHKLDLPFLERHEHHKAIDLHEIIEHGRHALAIDEHRALFEPTLFPSPIPSQSLEQRWFIGSHANVGGGYERDGLFLRPLQWMADEAAKKQLVFKRRATMLPDSFYRSTVIDSLQETFYGAYYLTQRFRPFYRSPKLQDTTHQTLDFTILQRWLWDRTYDSPVLRSLLGAKVAPRPGDDRTAVSDIGKFLPHVKLSPNQDHVDGFVV